MSVDKRSLTPRLDAKVRVPQHVVYRSFAAETVILNLETGKYHGLSPAAGRALELLDKAGSAREASARLARERKESLDQAERACVALCTALAALGLIEIGEQAA